MKKNTYICLFKLITIHKLKLKFSYNYNKLNKILSTKSKSNYTEKCSS